MLPRHHPDRMIAFDDHRLVANARADPSGAPWPGAWACPNSFMTLVASRAWRDCIATPTPLRTGGCTAPWAARSRRASTLGSCAASGGAMSASWRCWPEPGRRGTVPPCETYGLSPVQVRASRPVGGRGREYRPRCRPLCGRRWGGAGPVYLGREYPRRGRRLPQ